ncbi:hypothetical protein [Polyangium mundeleinium]|uniref:Uncharacterized protein n=1 Tax=Polyangium mundeleinium TaxID=2995306 RepID=A0ABT5F0E8_9BACT|nr:hypothetical protein [Polyangium mundeleinium]MDC0747114.1 hypothetical protein [Polyangium mundeleinium]
MKDEEVIGALQARRGEFYPVELAEYLGELTNGGLSQSTMVTYFKRAFPEIPLRVLLDAGGWQRLSNGGLTDRDFNALLQPWLDTR